MSEDRRSQTATANECARVRDSNGLEHVRVLYPKNFMALPDADLSRRHSHYVLSRGARLYHKRSFNDGTFEEAIDQLLAQD